MKIKKFMYIMIGMVVLIVSTWTVSFSYDSNTPNITSPLTEPVGSFTSDSSSSVLTVYMSSYRPTQTGDEKYILEKTVCTGDSSANYLIYGGRIYSDYPFHAASDSWYTETGVYKSYVGSDSHTASAPINTVFKYYFNVPGAAGGVGVPTGLTLFYPQSDRVSLYNPSYSPDFVTWAVTPPDQTSYHSKLSEPEWDLYNRYFIVDDKLYWISFDINGFYLDSESIEAVTGYYDYQAIVPVQGGYDSGYSSDYVQYAGYTPVSISFMQSFNTMPFSFVIVPDMEEWRVGIKLNPLFESYNNILDCNLYVSEFELYDGTYIDSSFVNIHEESLRGVTYSLTESGNFSSIRCYGVEFRNTNNLPINLSSVTWEYDIAWIQWRNAVQIYLRDIYNLLSNDPEEDINAPTYPAYGDDVNDAEPQYSDVAAEDVQQQLDEAVEGVDSYGDAAGQVKTWINDFIPPKILTVIIFALAFGVVILILGKNKDD